MKRMIGKVFTSVTGVAGGYEMIFSNGVDTFRFYHEQNCCESVSIEDVTGDISDLIGSEILMAEEVSGCTPDDYVESNYEACEWTFYKFATIKGYVDVRWFGTSNGYYSTSVSLEVS
jgi:hypothetical protein